MQADVRTQMFPIELTLSFIMVQEVKGDCLVFILEWEVQGIARINKTEAGVRCK